MTTREVVGGTIPNVGLKTITGSGDDKKTRILVLENQSELVELFRRTLKSSNREIHFAADEKDAVEWQSMDRFDIFVCVGWNVPRQATPTDLRRSIPKEMAITSVRDSTTGDDIVNKTPYIIAITHVNDFFTPDECNALKIGDQIVGPPDYINSGVFKDRLINAVGKAERELRREMA